MSFQPSLVRPSLALVSLASAFLAACAAPVATPASEPAPQPVAVAGAAPPQAPAAASAMSSAPPPPDAGVAAPPGSFDAEGTGYAYPYPVQTFAFESQRSAVRMAYLDVAPTGASNGRTVVLLHGKNFGAFAWGTTIASLSKAGFRVVAPDQIGFGKSSKPASYQYGFVQLAANTHALLAKLGIGKATIVGHSMGGMLATRYALLYPSEVDKLLLVNPIGLEDYGALLPARTVDQWYEGELKQTPESIRDYQRKAYYDGAWKPEYEALTELAAGMTKHPQYPSVAWANALTYDMIVNQPVVHDFGRLRVPTRLVIGLRDKTAVGKPFATPETQKSMGDYTKLGKATKRAIPSAVLVELPGVGHCPQVEAFPQWEKALLDFVR